MRDDYLDKVCTFYGILFMLEILEDVQSYNHLQKIIGKIVQVLKKL